MNIDPSLAVWIALALNAGGVLMMLGAKRQQIADLLKRTADNEDCIDRIEREKLAVSDYRREHRETHERITELDTRVDRRVGRIETRLDGAGGRR